MNLDEARLTGDPPADAVIAGLGPDVWVVNAALRHVHTNGEPLPPAVPETVRQLFAADGQLPLWFDALAARRAQRWASAHLLEITTALFCAALPTAYGAARGARVLASTARMQGKELDRRVNETAQFVLDVLAERAFSPTGAGLRAVQKVRLIHAAVRAHVKGRDEVAINQEDLLGTLFTFSVVVLRALRRLGTDLTAQAAEDYYQLWRGVGAMLGIDEALLPLDLAAAERLCDRVAARQHATSDAGRQLMAALLAGMESHVPFLKPAPRALVRYLVGDRLAELLGLPPDASFHAKLSLLRWLPAGALPVRLPGIIGKPLLEAVVAAKLKGPVHYGMPVRPSAGSAADPPAPQTAPSHESR